MGMPFFVTGLGLLALLPTLAAAQVSTQVSHGLSNATRLTGSTFDQDTDPVQASSAIGGTYRSGFLSGSVDCVADSSYAVGTAGDLSNGQLSP